MLCERSEFLTPYTPYQPEISQGGLQVMFEYQTAICELTALPVSNASVYEGPSALAAAAYMAKLHNGRRRLVVSAGVHPHALQTLRTYAHGYGMEVVEVPTTGRAGGAPGGVTDIDAWRAAIDADTSAALFAQPNFYGAVEDAAELSAAAKDRPAQDAPVVVASVDPITLGILKPPGECGVNVAVGEGQPLGNRLDFGGPSFGLFAAREEFLRRMPGRIAGETVNVDGRRGFVLTLQTREQHIRRDKATSNICTSQALNALAGVVYLAGSAGAGSSSWASCCSRAPTTPAPRSPRSTASTPCTSSPSCASSPSASTPTSRPSARAVPAPASTRAPICTRSPGASTIAAGCSSRSPSAAPAQTSTGSPRLLGAAVAAERQAVPV